MEIINNRYKLGKIIDEDLEGITWQAIDLWENKKIVTLRILKSERKDKLTEYFINNFLNLSSIRHKYLLYNDRFDVIYNIDNQNVNRNQYFFTKEFIEWGNLYDHYNKLDFEGRLLVVQKICDVIHFLHFRGINYKYLNPSNIYLFVDKHTRDVDIKLLDIATLKEKEANKIILNDSNNEEFVAPEVFLDWENDNKISDFYSIGKIMEYLFSTYLDDFKGKIDFESDNVSHDVIEEIQKIITGLTKKLIGERNSDLFKINHVINNITNNDYRFDFKRYREVLNFSTKIIGRDRELNIFNKICKEVENKNSPKKIILVKGENGIGKTRFLLEIVFQMRMTGKNVYFASIFNNEKERLEPIVSILRRMVKDCNKSLLKKYGSELIKLMPELRLIDGIKPSMILDGEKEKLRLFDRITNFILDYINDKPTFLIVDNIHNSDEQTLELIRFILSSSIDKPLLVVSSCTNPLVGNKSYINNFIKDISKKSYFQEIELYSMSVKETGEIVKNILGIDYTPIHFSTKLINSTLGNPRYIEEVLKNLFSSKELFINKKGKWELKAESYSSLHIPSNIDEVMKKQIELIEPESYAFLEFISIFKTSISKEIIGKICKINNDHLDEIINDLVKMKILDERVEDWGYTYDFYNYRIKSFVYHNIPINKRSDLHKLAANVLEDIYVKEGRENISELIYHLIMSSQKYKAVEYLVIQAKKMEGVLNNYALELWENAYQLLSDSQNIKKLEIMINIGKLLSEQESIYKALNMYYRANNLAMRLDEQKYIAICKINIGEILFRKNEINKAEKIILQAKKLSENIKYNEGIYKSIILQNRILFSKGDTESVLRICKKYFELVTKQNDYEYMGHFLNHIGIAYIYLRKICEGQKYFEHSISCFEKAGLYSNCTKPINNIGVIYTEYYFDLDKAMNYYKKGLRICEKYNNLIVKIWFLNNIGEIYIRKDDYEKAREYMKSANKIAVELGESSLVFCTIVNLCLIHLEMGQYDKCNKYLYEAGREYEKHKEDSEYLSHYFDLLASYYYKMGNWKKAYEYSKMVQKNTKDFEQFYFVRAQSRLFFVRYYNLHVFDKVEIYDIKESYKNNNIYGEQRKFLLTIAQISIDCGDFRYAKDILDEDKHISNMFDTQYLSLYREIIEFALGDCKKGNISLLEKKVKGSNNGELNLLLNNYLGRFNYLQKNYPNAVSYYLNYIDILYTFTVKIHEKQLQISFINKYLNNEIKNNLIKSMEILTGKELSDKVFCELDESTDLKKYFNLSQFVGMLDNKMISKIMLMHSNISIAEEIDSLEDLIQNFSNDNLDNLKLILRYAIKETFSKRGAIFLYNDKRDALTPWVFEGSKIDSISIDKKIRYIRLANDGILVNNAFKHKQDFSYLDVSEKDIKAFICCPIFKMKDKSETLVQYVEQDDRRKRKCEENTEEILGFIYLDTDNMINRFDRERFNLIKVLSSLIYINIYNYNLKVESSIDKMTGVYTRKYFDFLFEQYIDKVNNQREKFSILMIDIDLFKIVNDTFGHQKGDEILNKIGSILKSNVRSTDIIGRYGGEEFIIILKDTNEEQAGLIGEKIRKAIELSKLVDLEYPLTVSIGISIFPNHGQYKDDLIEKADQALYVAKEEGRNKTIVWEKNLIDSRKRVDKLAGIITGNTTKDQRNVLAIVEIINLVKKDLPIENKIFRLLGRVIEITDAKQGKLFVLNNSKEINKIYSRRCFTDQWDNDYRYNKKLIDRVIKNNIGEYLIDWEFIEDKDVFSGIPNWQSVVIIPITFNKDIKAVLQISSSINEKEFDYNDYNLINTIASIASPIFYEK